MTLRAKPVSGAAGRPGWNSGDRRTFLLNLGFAIAIVGSILILVGYTVYSWYDGHFGAVATVDGTTITNDQLRTRYAIENFRIDYTLSRIRTLQAAGRISEANATSQIQFLEQRRNSLPALTVERLIDVALQAKLAAAEGLSVSEAEIDAQLIDEATTEEERHVWVIEIAPLNDADTGEPGPGEKAVARGKAEKALADLRAGTSWEDVAKTASTSASAVQNGDFGWLQLKSGYDESLMAAVFAAAPDEPTGAIEGADGVLRIGRVTEIASATVDGTLTDRILDQEIKVADYREAVRGDLVRRALSDKIVADLSAPSEQRQVLQIFLPAETPTPDGVKVRHILFSPKDDPGAATQLPETDPAWSAAKLDAQAAFETLIKDPSTFDGMARTMSDEGSARSSGGKLPYYAPTSPIDPAFAAAIFKKGLRPGDLIPPFKSQFGWHVVQFMRPYGLGEKAWIETVRRQALDGTDFAQLARDQGEGPEAPTGGDIGWVAVGQLGDLREAPIFSAKVGDMTAVVEIPDEGVYLFKVVAEETRPATREQIAIFESSGFNNWYSVRKAAAKIERSGPSSDT
ncbi:MAG: Peptidylprolyl isomerase [Chloroflexi bacterium]|nr:Peptidylprolyl isomerase [Chloroflexota bacterium]